MKPENRISSPHYQTTNCNIFKIPKLVKSSKTFSRFKLQPTMKLFDAKLFPVQNLTVCFPFSRFTKNGSTSLLEVVVRKMSLVCVFELFGGGSCLCVSGCREQFSSPSSYDHYYHFGWAKERAFSAGLGPFFGLRFGFFVVCVTQNP